MRQDAGLPAIGAPAPDFELESDSGETFRLSSLRGRAHVVLHFVREFT